jgi:hypothetical protein
MSNRAEYLLQQIASAQRIGEWRGWDDLLGELGRVFHPELVAPLLSTLTDDIASIDEAFGLVHLAESVDDSSYVAGLMDALPVLRYSAPQWARTLLVRVLNSPSAFSAMTRLVPSAVPQQRAALMDVLDAIESWKPGRFDSRTSAIRHEMKE